MLSIAISASRMLMKNFPLQMPRNAWENRAKYLKNIQKTDWKYDKVILTNKNGLWKFLKAPTKFLYFIFPLLLATASENSSLYLEKF